MNITITNVRNANELDAFIPVEGQWTLHPDSDDRSAEGIEQSVRNYMDASYPIRVELFRADGHAITDDMPAHGTFLATRK